MIGEAPLLRINRSFTRPSAEIVARFAGTQTGHAVDAMGGQGAVHERIKPLTIRDDVMVGVAVTSQSGPCDNLGLFASLDLLQPGDVLIASADNYTAAAITGDLLMGMARNLGAVGFVTDGAVRDRTGLLAVGVPIYAAGLTPNSPARSGPGTAGFPVVVGGVPVASGDIVIGDADGVVIVPQGRIEEVLAALEAVREAEAGLEAKVKAGLGVPDFLREILDSDRTLWS
ncbi:RraA family protein [Acuticoccus kandeliae]|uniref:RraA family protein n=1 Tax=Acuticoccus kandeliae TaxID=2073160 RepID=UPI000D3EC478|nr:aldolase [Acuticoccus kandeliae]